MSDTTYNLFQHYGTAAERAAFVPDPAVGIQPIYVWYETDTDDFYIYTTAWKGPFSGGGGGTGDVVGPVIAVDNQIALFNGVTGKLIKAGNWKNLSHLYPSVDATSDLGVIGLRVRDVNASRALTIGPGSPASVGAVRLSNNTGIYSRNATGLADIELLKTDISNVVFLAGISVTTLAKRTLTFIFDNGASDLVAATQSLPVSSPYAGTIIGARLLSPQTGTIVIDVWKDTYANYPPTVADTITASEKPTLTAVNKSDNTTLTGWNTAVLAGDIFIANVDSCTGIHACVLQLTLVVT